MPLWCPVTAPLSGDAIRDSVMVTSKDGLNFSVARVLILKSKIISKMLEDNDESGPVELPVDADAETLRCVFEFLDYHHEKPMKTIEKPLRGPFKELVEAWDWNFFQTRLLVAGDEKQNKPLQKVICAANFLIIDDLRTFACAALASLIMNKTEEEIFDLFGAKGKILPEHWERLYLQFPYMRPKDAVKATSLPTA